MALNAYLKLAGQKSGEVKGSVTQKGREGKILVISADHQIVSPRDAATGLSTGKRQHRPFVITKELDRSSPVLYSMVATNETITTWELQFYAPGASTPGAAAVEVQRYTVKLVDAHVAEIKFHMPNSKNPDLQKFAEYEEIAFVYEHIHWIWPDGGIEFEDSWRAAVT
jgi:type VI secretion system secreted protein Hcp